MIKPDTPLEMTQDMAATLPAPITIVAAQRHFDALNMSPNAVWLSESSCLPVAIDEPMPFHALSNDGLLIVEVNPAEPSSMRRIRQIRDRFPGLKIIVAMDSADLLLVRTLVREGVADVVGLPLSPEEIVQSVVALFESSEVQAAKPAALAPVIAVTRALGGSGASTLASNLAAEFARDGASVCILDLDIQFGRLAELFGTTPRCTLSDLLDAGSRLDGEFLRSVAIRSDSGVSLVAAPREIMPIKSVRDKDIAAIVTLAQRYYDYVILDLSASLTNWVLGALSRADRIVVACQENVTSLQHTKRLLDLFAQLGLDKRLVSIVPNQVERKLFSPIKLGDVETALHHKVEGVVRQDAQIVEAAQDRGQMVSTIRPKSHFAADIRNLAAALLGRLGGEGEP